MPVDEALGCNFYKIRKKWAKKVGQKTKEETKERL